MAEKAEEVTVEHLEWLVRARTRNQTSALKLYGLFDAHPSAINKKPFARQAQHLLAACFSLWRAAFLADGRGNTTAVMEDAKGFLQTLIADNAIAYLQDKNSRGWTFGYYMRNARYALSSLPRWTAVQSVLDSAKSKGRQDRWDKHQKAFEKAMGVFAKQLEEEDGKFFEM